MNAVSYFLEYEIEDRVSRIQKALQKQHPGSLQQQRKNQMDKEDAAGMETRDSPNKGVKAEMDTFVAPYF